MKTRHALASLTVAVAAAGGALGVHAAGASGNSSTAQEHFVLVQTDPAEDAPQTVYAVGPVSGVAVDNVLSDTRDEFAFPDGTITIDHTARHHKENFDTTTCEGTFSESGTYTVVSGTGAYESVRGHGTYTVNAAAKGSCDENTPPSSLVVIIEADGPLSL
jgi:hypothetical protein